ncbi:MAG TPA: lamin tail domain-containing protein, partial [Methylomirabilota bacterium]|nr:lamin tail domain-containing protein [Methylomirabilota bacterium]
MKQKSCCILGRLLIPLLLAVPLPAWSQTVFISEFMASNGETLSDEDGEFGDWIELFNPGVTAVDLDGWYLTDNEADLTKWRIPAVTLAPKGFVLVFASGKNRSIPGAPLHANFSLNVDGEYLALVEPDGVTVASEFAPAYPSQVRDISYGLGQDVTTNLFLTSGSPLRYRVPADDSLGTTWRAEPHDDSGWSAGQSAIGYETSVPGFAVRNVKANVTVGHLTTAETVLATPSQQTSVVSENAAVISYYGTGGTGNYGNNRTFPGHQTGADVDDFVIEATATITIPSAGAWTFGVNSDDGFSLEIGGFFMSFPDPRGPADTLGVFNVPAAGDYPLRLVFSERGGGAG